MVLFKVSGLFANGLLIDRCQSYSLIDYFIDVGQKFGALFMQPGCLIKRGQRSSSV